MNGPRWPAAQGSQITSVTLAALYMTIALPTRSEFSWSLELKSLSGYGRNFFQIQVSIVVSLVGCQCGMVKAIHLSC